MALDRQSIEKKDFPIGRRGYDPEAVDAHLAEVAAEMERLRTESRRRTDSLASQASEQVRMIVEAAEQSAAEILRQAEADAAEIRGEADTVAQSARQQANEQAREYVAQVSTSSSGMVERVDAMGSELATLVETLRTSANRINSELAVLEGGMSELRGATEAHTGVWPESPDARDREAGLDLDDGLPAEPEMALDDGSGELLDTGSVDADLAGIEGQEPIEAHDGDDAEGARLVALNMALNGTPRDETDRYLAENYALTDRDGLLDEVYATVGE
jgi:DivIVA domain-containing protein